jgi:FAD/FMN-containing dehydrogenase
MKRRTFCASTLSLGAASLPIGKLFAASDPGGMPAIGGSGKQLLLSQKDILDFQGGFKGKVLLPGQSGYEQARKVWNGSFDRKPAVIASCTDAADVARAVSFGRSSGLLVAVRGGGHSMSGQSACEGGLLIDLSPMRAVSIDAANKRAHVQPGVLLGELDREAQAVKLVTPAGTVSHTGVAGLTLGGGYGRLARKFGLTCDNFTNAEVVTAEGKLIKASATENPDLMWGLRGGGGNFGVVTGFDFQLHEQDPMVYGGVLIFPVSQARDVLRVWSEYGQVAPDEFCADAVLMRGQDGAPVLQFAVCYSGKLENAERALKPLRDAGKPIVDKLGPVPYVNLQKSGDAANPHGRSYYIKSGFPRKIDAGLMDAMIGLVESATVPIFNIVLVHQGGAIARVDAASSAITNRDRTFSIVLVTAWDDTSQTSKNVEWARGAWKKIEPFTDGYYINTANADDAKKRVQESYGPYYDRLVALKRKYDPTNLFHLNANIAPGA